ncbi:MAG: hypothetical protein HQM02_02350, partial [Magnetococcales bacterium]|nr:hypothetical protein [Magnetococcales bacterium]
MISKRKRIGWHLTEALVAAVVGGIVTIMVWHPSAGIQATEVKTEQAQSESDTKGEGENLSATKNETTAKFESMDELMQEPKAGQRDATRVEAKEPVTIETEGRQLATNVTDGKDEPMDDAIALEDLDETFEETMEDTMEQPLVKNAEDAKSVAKAPEAPQKKYLSLDKSGNGTDAKSASLTKAEHKPVAKAEHKPVAKAEHKPVAKA